MNFYQEFTLLPSADISLYFLWEKIYQQIHLGLTAIKTSNGFSPIGLAFPEYDIEKYSLGAKLRLFAQDQMTLENFNAKKWLSRLTDYVHMTSIRSIPSNIKSYVRYKRQQSKSNIQRLARRKARRESMEVDHALQLLSNQKEILIKAPFIKVSSNSTGQSFRVFIIKELASELIKENFSCYGLSSSSTVPEF